MPELCTLRDHLQTNTNTLKSLLNHRTSDNRYSSRKLANFYININCFFRLSLKKKKDYLKYTLYRPRQAKLCLRESQSLAYAVSASTQSDQVLHCSLTESLDIAKCMNGEQRPRWYFAHAQDDLNLRILCIDTLDTAHMIIIRHRRKYYENTLIQIYRKFQLKEMKIFR